MNCIDLMSKRSKIAKLQKQSNSYQIDLTSKRSKMSSYVVKHWKLRKTQNYKSNQIRINLHRFDVKTIKNVELRRKTFKTTQNYKSHQITMNCIDLMSKRSNQRKTTKVILFRWICIDLTSERSKQRKTTKVIKLQWIASIWCQNDQKSSKLQKWSIKFLLQFASIWRQNDQKCRVTS